MDSKAFYAPSFFHRGGIIKTLRIMRLTAFLLLAACLQVSARGFGQTVTLSVKDAPLAQVLDQVKKQTGFSIFWDEQTLKGAHPVTLDLKNTPLDQALDACLRDQPLTYRIVENLVIIKPRPATAPVLQSADSLPGPGRDALTIRGTVYNESGQPMVGANVILKENNRGVSTNERGDFTYPGLSKNKTLIFSFIGYASQQLKIERSADIKIYLKVAKSELDKVVIQAYGTTSQRLTTGNIATVRAEDIERQPIMNPLEALQGKVAGLVITETSGYASAPIKVEIRGQNSINRSPSDPLYIIDGVPLTISQLANPNYPQLYGSATSPGFIQNSQLSGPASGQSPFFNLNPADIESIEVLKDADATAIYGSRGANGVILITTKKGKPGKTKLDINVYQGVNVITMHWDMLNTPQYLQVRREAFKNDGITPTPGNAPDLLVWDTTRYTDWQKYIWGNLGRNTSAQVSLSGGDPRTTFRIGAGYDRMTDITTVSGANQRGSMSFTLSHKTIDQRASVDLSAAYSFSEADMIGMGSIVTAAPNAPPPFTRTGQLNYAQYDSANQSLPFANLLQPYTSKTGFLNTNMKINFEIIHGLVFTTSLGYNTAQNNQTQFIPIASLDTYSNPNVTGQASFGNNRNNTWIIEPQLQYNRFIAKGKINALIGGSKQSSVTEGLYTQGQGYTNDALIRTINNAPIQHSTDNYAQYKYAAVFGRINYNWMDKYILNVNARRDGSSRFGPGKQYGDFGSIAAAWIFTEEPWLRRLSSLLSFGKFRASYGTTGGDGVGDYAYLSRWQATLLPYNGTVSLLPIQHVDSTFHWQVNKKLEAALDLGFLKDRITVEVAYYRNRCNDQLVGFPLPIFTGFSSVTANSPASVQNSGLEFLLNAKLIDAKKFGWTINFNLGINRNKLLSYPNLAQSPYANAYQVGKPLGMLYLFHYVGIDPLTGQYQFQDKNKDGQITINYSHEGVADDLYAFDLTPRYTGGFGSTFRYNRLELTTFFYFKKQLGQNAYQNLYTGIIKNQPTTVLNHWQKPGDQSNNPVYTTNPGAPYADFGMSTGIYTDASYCRLRNATLSYSLPENVTKKAGMQSMSIFFKGENLFVITKYKGLDPETQNFGGMPPNKVFTGGISFTF
jgi:TonB-linked SusC/RagA family outer membrane protein